MTRIHFSKETALWGLEGVMGEHGKDMLGLQVHFYPEFEELGMLKAA